MSTVFATPSGSAPQRQEIFAFQAIAFGASPDLIPGGKWPNDTYDWVVVLTFDSAGHLHSQRLVKETLTLQ